MRTTDHTGTQSQYKPKIFIGKDTFSFSQTFNGRNNFNNKKKHLQLLLLKINVLGKNDN